MATTVPNFPPAPREPFVDSHGTIARSWFRYLSDLLAVIPGFVNALVSGTGFWKSTSGVLSLTASSVDLATSDVTGILPVTRTSDSGVVAGTYGDATHVVQETIDSHGRVTVATNIPITFPVSSVSNADGSVTVAPTTGDVDVSLPLSGVVAGSYTNTDLTVNDRGIITAASNGTGGGGGNVGVLTVATLPATTQGTFGFVTDADTTLILGLESIVVGGGANFVPVYADGAAWRIG